MLPLLILFPFSFLYQFLLTIIIISLFKLVNKIFINSFCKYLRQSTFNRDDNNYMIMYLTVVRHCGLLFFSFFSILFILFLFIS